MLAQGAVVTGALVDVPGGGVGTTTTLTANPGNFVLTGAASFVVTQADAAGLFLLTGKTTVLVRSLGAVASPFVLTGISASFSVAMAEGAGSLGLTGNVAALRSTVFAAAGSLALTGATATLRPTLGATARSYAVSWQTFSGNTTVAVQAGSFTLSGIGAYLSYDVDLGGIGGRIIPHHAGDELRSGTPFTRRHYRDLIDGAVAEHEAGRSAREHEVRRARAIADAADARARAALRARWAQEDALVAADAQARALEGALSAFTGAQSVGEDLRRAGLMAQAAQRAKQNQDEEDEAIALLLLS